MLVLGGGAASAAPPRCPPGCSVCAGGLRFRILGFILFASSKRCRDVGLRRNGFVICCQKRYCTFVHVCEVSKVYENLLHPASMPCFGGQRLGKGSWLSQVMKKIGQVESICCAPRIPRCSVLAFEICDSFGVLDLPFIRGLRLTLYPGLGFTVCLGVRIYDLFGVLD